jgi:putative (di)nucleoside polyphosphate hydrolase
MSNAVDHLHLPYRACVGIALFNDAGQVFVGERIDSPGAWQMPQGGIDEGEELKVAAYREMLEEIGTDKAEILEIGTKKLRYDLPPHLLGRLWKNKYRGQEQTWIALRYTGQDSDIRLDAHNPAEFQRWKWVELDQILELIVPFKKDTYQEVINMFGKFVTDK